MTGQLQGKVAVITGGNSGIGLATAHRFVDEGAQVVIAARRETELAKAAAEIGRNVSTVVADVSSLDDLDRLFGQVRAEHGVVDVVVANAGFVEHQTLEVATPEHFDKTFGINARGVFFTAQKALPLMTRGGSIVLVSSGMRQKGFPAHSAYSATKAAVRSFARVWGAELTSKGIRVNSISAGAIETPIIDSQFDTAEKADAARQSYAAMTPLGRLGNADEIAAGIMFLASDQSSYVTGADLAVDGGIVQV
jgi:NAD(P)-dependent dehydrogenase (short-subunit alcohol dehydrogenase family)